MGKIIDLTGVRFGSLTAEKVTRVSGEKPVWLCACDCGGSATATNSELNRGRKKGCPVCTKNNARAGLGVKGSACVNYKHGGASRGENTKEYKTWASMRRRCELPSQRSYKHYGGRGITVCPEWTHDFEAFVRCVGMAPSEKHTLDRIDPNGNYEPGNVRWATMAEQSVNRTNNDYIEYRGERLALSQWADRFGIKYQTLWARIHVYKWPVETAFTAPINEQHLRK